MSILSAKLGNTYVFGGERRHTRGLVFVEYMVPVAEAALSESEAVSADDLSVRHRRLPVPRPEEQLPLLLAGQVLGSQVLAGGSTLGDRTGSHLECIVLSWLLSELRSSTREAGALLLLVELGLTGCLELVLVLLLIEPGSRYRRGPVRVKYEAEGRVFGFKKQFHRKRPSLHVQVNV